MAIVYEGSAKECIGEGNVSDTAKYIVDKLGFDCKILAAGSECEDILNCYNEMVEEGKKLGYTPVIVPSDEYFELFVDEDYSVEELCKEDILNGKELLDKFLKMSFGEEDESLISSKIEELKGEFNDTPDDMSGHVSLYDYSTGACGEVSILKVPTTKPWEVVAYIPFGGFNDCPLPKDMMAICKYWYEEYGAIPMIISHDVLEFRLPAPVPEEKSMDVAIEHFAFSPDRVHQCTSTYTLDEVAASIAVSNAWYFWWD